MISKQDNVDNIKQTILKALHSDNRDIDEIQDAAEAISELWEINPELVRAIEKGFILWGKG